MKRMNMGLLACILATLLLALVTSPLAQTAHAAASTCGAWSVVKSPNPGQQINILYGTATISSNNIWAVGTADQSGTAGLYQTLTQHWNGSSWSVVKSPDPGGSGNPNVLQSAAVVSSNDIWAVGNYETNGHYQALAEHWNGTNWSAITTPSLGYRVNNYLNGVAAISTGDVWAAGYYQSSSGYKTLIEQWNGTKWSVVKSPNAVSDNYLNALVAISANNIWAVGGSGTVYYPVFTAHTLTEQWNGTRWNIVPSSNPGTGANTLYAAAAVDASHVWAVGTFGSTGGSWYSHTLSEFYC